VIPDKRNFLILLGIPGAGKGTQARLLEEKLQIPQISTGDIFRYNLKNKTELGLLAQGYMDRGELVPDEVTIQMVEDRLKQDDAQGGAILDGFPRNLIQAEAFDKMTAPYGGVSLVPLIMLNDEESMRRITGRRVCRSCGATYHIDFNPPISEGVCDLDSGELYQREDDQPEPVRKRLSIYHEDTAPLIEYYSAKSLLVELDGSQSIEDVQNILLGHLSDV